jgi:hypothetical protein
MKSVASVPDFICGTVILSYGPYDVFLIGADHMNLQLQSVAVSTNVSLNITPARCTRYNIM